MGIKISTTIRKSGSTPLAGDVTFTGSGSVTITQSGNNIDISATSGGGGGNFGQAQVDFGVVSQNDFNALITVAAAWVTASSKIICNPFGGATADHDAEDAMVEKISAYATNIVAGVGFDIQASAPFGTWGKYLINYSG